MHTIKQITAPLLSSTVALSVGYRLLNYVLWTLLLFLLAERVIKLLDPLASVLDIGILSLLLFGILATLASILCSFWLQELLWQPFKKVRQQFSNHFNRLTSWQQCILYFSVFFLLLYASLWALQIIL